MRGRATVPLLNWSSAGSITTSCATRIPWVSQSMPPLSHGWPLGVYTSMANLYEKCTACGWVGALVRLACPTCDTLQPYCSDCRVGSRPFNCGECQAPQEPLPSVWLKCPMCSQKMAGDTDDIKSGILIICDGCHSTKFDKTAAPGLPGLYYPYTANACGCGRDCGSLRN